MAKAKRVFEQLEAFVKCNDLVSLEHLLKWQYNKDAIFRQRNNEGLHILHLACLKGNLEMVFILIDQGADIHQRSSVGWTALHAAVIGGSESIVSYLVNECCADVTNADDTGNRPADLTGDPSILSLLEARTTQVEIKQSIDALAPYVNVANKRFSLQEEAKPVPPQVPSRRNKPTRSHSLTEAAEHGIDIRYQYVKNDDKQQETPIQADREMLYPNWEFKSRPGKKRVKSRSKSDADKLADDRSQPNDARPDPSTDEADKYDYKGRTIPRATFKRYFNQMLKRQVTQPVCIDAVGQYTAFIVKAAKNDSTIKEEEPETKPPVAPKPTVASVENHEIDKRNEEAIIEKTDSVQFVEPTNQEEKASDDNFEERENTLEDPTPSSAEYALIGPHTTPTDMTTQHSDRTADSLPEAERIQQVTQAQYENVEKQTTQAQYENVEKQFTQANYEDMENTSSCNQDNHPSNENSARSSQNDTSATEDTSSISISEAAKLDPENSSPRTDNGEADVMAPENKQDVAVTEATAHDQVALNVELDCSASDEPHYQPLIHGGANKSNRDSGVYEDECDLLHIPLSESASSELRDSQRPQPKPRPRKPSEPDQQKDTKSTPTEFKEGTSLLLVNKDVPVEKRVYYYDVL